MSDAARELVNEFNDGDWEGFKMYFNDDIISFFKYLNRLKLLDEIDLGEIPSNDFDDELFDYLIETDMLLNADFNEVPDEFHNHYLLYQLENNYDWAVKHITNNVLTDVDIRPDGFYLHIGTDIEELANYFCSGGRDTSDYDVAKMIFSENGLGHYWYSDYDRKPSETIDVLDDSNKTKLKGIIFKEIGNQEMPLDGYNSDFFQRLSEIQGTDGYFIIRDEDLDGLIKDDEAINELCNTDLDELGYNLRSLYSNSENLAYEDEVYSLVFDGLDEFFEGKIDEVPREVTRSDGTKITRYNNYIKIRNFNNIVETFLENNKGSTYSDSSLDYYGGFTELIKGMINNEDIECINFRIPDYPDWSRTKKNINEMFDDYI